MNLALAASDRPPREWDETMSRWPDTGYASTPWWIDAACRNYAAQPLWITARAGGELVGVLAAIRRRRRGLLRLESGLEGSPAGPLAAPALAAAQRDAVQAGLATAYGARVRGRVMAAVMTLADPASGRCAAPGRWRCEPVPTAVIDLTPGLAHVEAHVLSNNRRNERNRGLKRGCTLHCSGDPADVAAWYPVYAATAAAWAQAPVPLGFMQDLVGAHAYFVHVRHEGAIIGGHLCVPWGDRVTALYGASRADVARELFPATLLYWQDLVEACARGAACLDFGGDAGQPGLRRFKQLMGTTVQPRLQCTRWQPLARLATAARRVLRSRP